jgi:hypothetical protein
MLGFPDLSALRFRLTIAIAIHCLALYLKGYLSTARAASLVNATIAVATIARVEARGYSKRVLLVIYY